MMTVAGQSLRGIKDMRESWDGVSRRCHADVGNNYLPIALHRGELFVIISAVTGTLSGPEERLEWGRAGRESWSMTTSVSLDSA